LKLAINKTTKGDQWKDGHEVKKVHYFFFERISMFSPLSSSLVLRDPTHAMQVNYVLLSMGQ